MISIKRKIISFLITGAALIVLFLVAVNTGSLKASPEQILRGLFVAYDETVATIYSLRFPRILIAMLAGAAVAVSGVMLQAVMKNPLADPGIMGISSGAGMAAVLVTAFTLLLADTIGRTIAYPYEINAAVVMAVIGGPSFILLLRRSKTEL